MNRVNSLENSFSIYLDFLRLTSALFVFIYHLKTRNIGTPSILNFIPELGHFAVILFFVLSGLVISASAHSKHDYGLRQYLIDRASRILSVALPSLLLSFFLATLFANDLTTEVKNILISTIFLGHSLNIQVNPFWNTPFWSLCYEVMYYICFASFIFFSGWKRIVLLVLSFILAGPKILLLMPCWLLGVFIYHYKQHITLNKAWAIVFGLLLPALLAIALFLGVGTSLNQLSRMVLGSYFEHSGFSNRFITDFFIAFIFALHIWAMRSLLHKAHIPLWIEKIIKLGAGMSFTLYLFHQPIVRTIDYFSINNKDAFLFVSSLIIIPTICFFVSLITERKRYKFAELINYLLPCKSKV